MDRPHTSDYLREFRWYRRSRLWVVPTAGAAAALLISVGSLTLDHVALGKDAPFPVFTGSTETAQAILTLIATSIATLTALVLTIVAVVIQLATQALSPRAVRTFLQDAHSHLTIGTFVTTFTYALIVLQQFSLISTSEQGQVASSSVTIAFVLAVVSIGMFISYVDHIVHQARVTSIIDRIANETRYAIERQYGSVDGQEPGRSSPQDDDVPDRDPDHVVRPRRHGVVLEIDVKAVIATATELELVVEMIPAPGDFIPTDGRLFTVYGERAAEADRLLSQVAIDAERSITQDIPFGFRLLIDIAERSLSPGINDPTTATQVLDQLHDLLLMLGTRDLSTGRYHDRDGILRLKVNEPDWDVYVALAFEEVRIYGASSMQTVRRIRAGVLDLCHDLPEDRHPPLLRQLELLDATVERGFHTEAEQRSAASPDRQGIGSGSGFDRVGAASGPSPGDRRHGTPDRT
jgi:uncharacterized membrane protein